jgi:uncharacterized protein (DUF1800 family)
MVVWTYKNAAHLLRRSGFGAPRKDVEKAIRAGQAKAVEKVLKFKPSGARYRGKNETYRMQRWWIRRMLHSKKPLAEKLTLFWHGHFATSIVKVEDVDMMSDQNALFRLMGAGKFRDLLLAVSMDPAMLVWLDNRYNTKRRPNENYGREIMELFTLGVADEQGNPNYTQADVVDCARAFTGWGLGPGDVFEFHPNSHDEDPKTVLGLTGNLDGGDVVNHLVTRPQCARWIARCLWTFFAYPDPETAVIDALAQAYLDADTEIEAVLRAMFLRDEFYSARAYEGQVATPVEFVLGSLRTLDAKTNAEDLPGELADMGQDLFNPPNVAGWPGGLAWMTSVTRLSRYGFAWDVASARGRDRRLSFKVEKILKGLPPGSDAAAVVDHVLQGVGPVFVGPEAEAALATYLDTGDGGGTVPFDPSDPDAVDKKVRGLIGLVLTLPEAHLG